MSIYSEEQILGLSNIQKIFMESSPNRPVTISLYQVPDGGSKKETKHSLKDCSLSMSVCGLFSFTDPDGGCWKIQLEGSVIISGQHSTPTIHLTTEIHIQSALVSGESSPCHKRTP